MQARSKCNSIRGKRKVVLNQKGLDFEEDGRRGFIHADHRGEGVSVREFALYDRFHLAEGNRLRVEAVLVIGDR